jgi:hypothetical protein
MVLDGEAAFLLEWGLLFRMLFVLTGGLISWRIDRITVSGQRLKLVFSTLIFSSLLIGAITGVLTWNQSEPINGLINGLISAVAFGLSMMLIDGLNERGFSLIRYYTLRFVLIRHHQLPRHLIDFLDFTVGLIFLRRVGGGYIFVHRLLMEHFAQLNVENQILIEA